MVSFRGPIQLLRELLPVVHATRLIVVVKCSRKTAPWRAVCSCGRREHSPETQQATHSVCSLKYCSLNALLARRPPMKGVNPTLPLYYCLNQTPLLSEHWTSHFSAVVLLHILRERPRRARILPWQSWTDCSALWMPVRSIEPLLTCMVNLNPKRRLLPIFPTLFCFCFPSYGSMGQELCM